MKAVNNIVLIGMPGAGKTTVGKYLAKTLNFEFIDLDILISENEKMAITDIFKNKGEEYFRILETDFLKKLVSKKNIVLSTGGGTPKKDENIDILKNIGISFYLEIEPNKIFDRIKEDKNRPLLKNDSPFEVLEKLYNERKQNYKKADYIINADRKIEDITSEIIKIYEEIKR